MLEKIAQVTKMTFISEKGIYALTWQLHFSSSLLTAIGRFSATKRAGKDSAEWFEKLGE
jgi:hypothetical protein